MRFAALLLLAALAAPAVIDAAHVSSRVADLDPKIVAAHPGWGRRQLLKKHKNKGEEHDHDGGHSGSSSNVDLQYHVLTRSGMAPAAQPDAQPMGGLIDQEGKPIFLQPQRGGLFGPISDPADVNNTSSKYYVVAGQQEISSNPDYTSFLPQEDGKLYSFTHFEGPTPSQLYFMELQQGREGMLSVVRQKAVDWSKWGGLWLPCAGSVTPWGTHLGSEEYEPDARKIEEAKTLTDISSDIISFMRYYGVYYSDLTLEKVKELFNPYHFGYITELSADGFKYDNVKHYTMGRKSNEMGTVMPDRRTVYMSDDGTNTALYKFVARKAGDLSEGTIYMAKVKQQGSGDPSTTTFDVKWIPLGSATQSDIKKLVDVQKIKFSDIFATATPAKSAPFCPDGFASINAGQSGANQECLRVKPGMEQAAAFLETRRYGATLGGTTEFSKLEGQTYNRQRNTLAFSVSDVRQGMEDNMDKGKPSTKFDIGSNNDVRLKNNPCGCVWEYQLDSNFDAKRIVPIVCGKPDTSTPLNGCSVDSIASPDNLALITAGKKNILVIGEDTDLHQNDMVWTFDYETKKLNRIATSPYGSEFTSTDWYTVGDYGYLSAVVQHPYGESDEKHVLDPESTGRAGTIGYLGPIPLADVKGKGITFAELDWAKTNAQKNQIRFTPSLAAEK